MLFLSELFPAPTSAHYWGTNKVHVNHSAAVLLSKRERSENNSWNIHTKQICETEAHKVTLITETQKGGYNHQNLLNIEEDNTEVK